MADKVKPLKIENPATGGSELNYLPTESDPSEDYLATKGIAFENNDNRLLDLSAGGELQYEDQVQTTKKTINSISNQADAARFTLILLNNSNMTNGQRFTYSELLPNAQVIVPMNCQLIAVAFDNNSSGSDWQFDFYKYTYASGYTSSSLLFTWSNNNTKNSFRNDRADSFLAGDEIRIIFTDTGDNPSDASMVLFFKVNP